MRRKKKRTLSLAHDNEQPKVLHVSTADSWRGGEQQLAYLFGELAKQDVPQVIVCRKDGQMHQYCEEHGLEHVPLKKRSSFDLVFATQLKRLSRDLEPDLIHTHDSHAHTFAFLSSLVFRNPVPIVVSRRVDFRVQGGLSRWKYQHHSIQAIICVSEAIQRILEEDLGPSERYFVVHSGIDPSRFDSPIGENIREEFEIPDDHWIIGNVAALAPHKDYYTFLDTVSLLLKREVKATFLMIGEGPEREGLSNYIQKRGLQDQVIMTGFRRDIPSILRQLDLFLITSETEGLGTSVLDAFVCGVPVVATNAGGIPEMVRDRETGMLGNVKDPESLCSKAFELIEDQSLREQVVDRARQVALENTVSQMADRTLETYLKIRDSIGSGS